MVSAVNRIASAPAVQHQAVAVRDPAPSARRARAEARGPADAASDLLSRARRIETEALLASMASAPPGAHQMAAHILQEAERKLVRLKAEARAAAASGDRRAARALARELAVLARQIADAAQDYAVAQARPDVVSPALAKAAARMNAASAPPEAGGAVDSGPLVGEAAVAASEVAEIAAAPEQAGTAQPDATPVNGESGPTQQPADQGLAATTPRLRPVRAARPKRASWSKRTGCSRKPWICCAPWKGWRAGGRPGPAASGWPLRWCCRSGPSRSGPRSQRSRPAVARYWWWLMVGEDRSPASDQSACWVIRAVMDAPDASDVPERNRHDHPDVPLGLTASAAKGRRREA